MDLDRQPPQNNAMACRGRKQRLRFDVGKYSADAAAHTLRVALPRRNIYHGSHPASPSSTSTSTDSSSSDGQSSSIFMHSDPLSLRLSPVSFPDQRPTILSPIPSVAIPDADKLFTQQMVVISKRRAEASIGQPLIPKTIMHGNPLMRLSRVLLEEEKPIESEWLHERETTQRIRSVDCMGDVMNVSTPTHGSNANENESGNSGNYRCEGRAGDEEDDGRWNMQPQQYTFDEQDYFTLANYHRRVRGSSRLNPALSSSLGNVSTPSSVTSSPTAMSFPSPRILSPRILPRNSPPPPLMLGKRMRTSSTSDSSAIKKRITVDCSGPPGFPTRTPGFSTPNNEGNDSDADSSISGISGTGSGGTGSYINQSIINSLPIFIPNNAGKQVPQLLNIQGASSGFSRMSIE